MKVSVSKKTFYELALDDGSVIQLSPEEVKSIYSGLGNVVGEAPTVTPVADTKQAAPGAPEGADKPTSHSTGGKPPARKSGRVSKLLSKPAVVVIAAFLMLGLGVLGGYALTSQLGGQKASGSGSANAYDMTIVITTNNWFNNSIGFEPAFYLLQNNQLTSMANISIPAGVPIHITIVNYDDGPAPVPVQYENVSGTVGNVVYIANDTTVNSSQPAGLSSGINVAGGQSVSSVNDSNIAHTFTLTSGTTVVVNIPIEPSAVETATFTIAAGFYHWHCMAACGSGASGWGGAMQTPGWMAGAVVAS